MRLRIFFVLIIFLLSGGSAFGKTVPAAYGIAYLGDSAVLQQGGARLADSVLGSHPMLASAYVISDMETPHAAVQQTASFYLLLFLCLLLGLIRFIDTRYFMNMWRAFSNPTGSSRQLKEQLQGAGLPNFLMNIFFTFAMGGYIYYVVGYFTPHHSGVIPPSLLIVMLIAGTAFIYLAKYLAVRFSGWAFRVEGITDQYLFNVFLVNKVLGIALVPFVIILAFADAIWTQEIVIISLVACGVLILNRYVRSWQVFGSFFQFSKFHFFMYLCASELLPLAILMKLLVKGLMFY